MDKNWPSSCMASARLSSAGWEAWSDSLFLGIRLIRYGFSSLLDRTSREVWRDGAGPWRLMCTVYLVYAGRSIATGQ